jgi:isochorismate pyruvate lyase
MLILQVMDSDRNWPGATVIVPRKGDWVPDGVTSLQDSRAELDALDVTLVQVLARRSKVILDVIRYKRANSMAVVDRDREDRMLAGIEQIAVSEGLDPRIARQVLRSVIDAFTLLEVEALGPDPS